MITDNELFDPIHGSVIDSLRLKSQNRRIKEHLFPFTFSGWDIQDTLVNSYYQVEFIDDFGVFKKGERYMSITVDYSKGIIEGYSEDGSEVEKTQKYSCLPLTN